MYNPTMNKIEMENVGKVTVPIEKQEMVEEAVGLGAGWILILAGIALVSHYSGIFTVTDAQELWKTLFG